MPYGMTDVQYKAEIQRKLATPGAPFTDKAAAQAFAPDLFKATPTATVPKAPATTTDVIPPSGRYTAGGEFIPANTGATGTSLRSLYPDLMYDPNTRQVSFGGQTFTARNIPGTQLVGGQHMVTDQNVLNQTLGIAQPEGDTYNDILQMLQTLATQQYQPQYNPQVMDIISQLQNYINNPQQYDPATDPAYQATAGVVEQGTMEAMNQRGILASTITRDQLAQNLAQIIPALQQQFYGRQQSQIGNLTGLAGLYGGLEQQQYGYQQDQFGRTMDVFGIMDTLQQREQQRQADEQAAALKQTEQQLENAWTRAKTLGYVDNQASQILGIPVGTPTFQAQDAYEDRKLKLQLAQQQLQLDYARLNKAGSGGTLPAQNRTTYSEIQQEIASRVKYYMQSDKITPWGAARQTEAELVANAPAYGMTAKQLKETTDLIYQVAGVPREQPKEKPPMTLKEILSAVKNDELVSTQAQAMIDKWYPKSGVKVDALK